jgi:hypothetical protein
MQPAPQLALGLAEYFWASSLLSRIVICPSETVRSGWEPAQAPVPCVP